MTANKKNRLNPETFEHLDTHVKAIIQRRHRQMGYPFDQNIGLKEFYQWLMDSGLYDTTLISVGSPWKEGWDMLDVDEFERNAVSFMAEAFGFPADSYWGFVSNGGTDGNMHGLYFGRKDLAAKSNIPPLLYVSAEAHYSVQKLGDILAIETRVIQPEEDGCMNVDDFRRQLEPSRPALIAVAVGGTFKGAIDDQKAIADVLNEKPPVAVYRHLDVALFGGYLPFLNDPKANSIINQATHQFDSVAVSGHKFLAANEPCGIFVCRKGILEHLNRLTIPYLNCVIPTISCSRSGMDVLKLYWRLFSAGKAGLKEEAERVLTLSARLVSELNRLGVKAFANPWSNTVVFPRPADDVVHYYCMACSGEFSHVVIMQYFDDSLIDELAHSIAQNRIPA